MQSASRERTKRTCPAGGRADESLRIPPGDPPEAKLAVCRRQEPRMRMIESILADAASIAAVRRDLHAHPELCFQEQRTADVIARQLTDWGIPIHRGLGKTGVVAI